MGKKKTGPDVQRILKDEARNTESPFSSIVLKEKKETPKKAAFDSARKKPGEIVHGYNPSLSFADILSSYEKTGNPYSMPKKASSAPSSFGDILDEWENGGKKGASKNKAAKNEGGSRTSSSYKATKSFGDILNQYEGIYREKEEVKKKKENISSSEAKSRVEDMLRTSAMFIEETEETSVSPDASWSVIGGKNPDFVRKEKKEEPKKEKKVSRSTPKYSSSVSFSDILSEYENGKSRKAAEEGKTAAKTPSQSLSVRNEKTEEVSFFISDSEETVPANVSWSILGGRNESFVRPEVAEEKKEEEEKPEKEVKRSSAPYSPKRDFGEILSSYSEKKHRKEEEKTPVPEIKESITVEETSFFISDSTEAVPSNVSWSILGGRNDGYVRPQETVTEEEKPKEVKRVSEAYSPQQSFSSILSSFEKKNESPKEKTFSEIMEEKGDRERKKSFISINELRRMDVQATLDLHGETQKDSVEMIQAFLSDCVSNGLRKVSVITGKGLHSESGTGVLRDVASSVLSSSPLVQEMSTAPLSKGGSGALWVILRENRDE